MTEVLVVDDDPRSREILSRYLREAGCGVTAVDGVDEALAATQRSAPNLITLDLNMPGKDGFDFLRLVADRPELKQVPILVVSSEGDHERALALGARATLSKPITRRELLKRVSTLTSPRRERRQPRVLLADDEPLANRVISTYLAEAGVEVVSAFDGRETLRLLQTDPPDLLILDLMMPDFSGYQVLEALGRSPATAQIPVIILSAQPLTKKQRCALEEHAQAVVSKSINLRESLLSQVAALLPRGRDEDIR